MRAIADRLDEEGLLRGGLTPQAAADALYAMTNGTTYLRLVEDCGLPPQRYAEWLTEMYTVTLLRTRAARSPASR
jgi:hypothetical protein